jgi:hypothetical protein
MTAPLSAPLGRSNFRVDLGLGDPDAPDAGFCEVIFPVLSADAGDAMPDARHLVLRRGATGALDLYAWWAGARESQAPARRTVTIELLSGDPTHVVMRWRFHDAWPVRLAYSPLDAMVSGLLFETVTLAFGLVDMG